jgi:DNA/RNA-binding domain of Phe-tRNA-synthetase-like protein
VFFRQIGIDPDERRTPAEAAALERMRAGGFQSTNLLDDALLIATVETGVPVLAFDHDRVQGDLGLRLALAGEEVAYPLRGGEIVTADQTGPLGVLFGDPNPDRGVTRATERMLLAAVQVKGVPDVSVEEALWTVTETLGVGA